MTPKYGQGIGRQGMAPYTQPFPFHNWTPVLIGQATRVPDFGTKSFGYIRFLFSLYYIQLNPLPIEGACVPSTRSQKEKIPAAIIAGPIRGHPEVGRVEVLFKIYIFLHPQRLLLRHPAKKTLTPSVYSKRASQERGNPRSGKWEEGPKN